MVYLYVTYFGEKNSFYLYLSPFYWFDQNIFFKQIQIFLRIYSFQTYKDIQTFRVFLSSFLRVLLFWLKDNFFVNLPLNESKQQKGVV